MIERLKESRGRAFGFKVTGRLTGEDVAAISQQIHFVTTEHHKPIGVLADLSEMQGATWAARWEEMRFLQTHSDHIARFAVVSNDRWEEVAEMAAVAAAAMQGATGYFQPSEILHAWHWVRMANRDEAMPVRIIYPGRGAFQDYTPEYMGI